MSRPETPPGPVHPAAPTLPAPPTLPVQLHVAGRRCVVVGGGRVGRRRAARLAEAGADVVVVDVVVDEELTRLAAQGGVAVHRGPFGPEQVSEAFLVVAATDDPAVNDAVAHAARSAGALVNRADDAAEGDLDLTGVVRRGPLTVALGTGGRAPAVTRWALERLDESIDGVLGLDADGVAMLVDVVAEVRAERAGTDAGSDAGAATDVTTGRPDWRSALDRTMLDLISSGRKAQAKERLQACLSSS